MTLVSKNGLSFIDIFAIEFEIRRKGPLHLTELFECPLFGPVTGHLEVPFTCDRHLDFVSLFEIESFDHRSGKTHSQTVTPFGNLHKRYTKSIVYPYKVGSNRGPSMSQTDGVLAQFPHRWTSWVAGSCYLSESSFPKLLITGRPMRWMPPSPLVPAILPC
jgi:hypothetical protein